MEETYVGFSDGRIDDDTLNEPEGISLAIITVVGCSVGMIIDGYVDEVVDIIIVGARLSSSLGSPDGLSVGLTEGPDGSVVGLTLGDRVGKCDGVIVALDTAVFVG